MKAVSFIRCQLVAIALFFSVFSHAGTPVFQWGDWVAPKSANAVVNPLKGDMAATAAGEQLFNTICFVCHGNKGKGDGINAAALERKPADLTSRRVQRQSDGALFWKITEGNPPMLRFKETLSEEQRWQMVNYVRHLAELYPPSEKDIVKSGEALPSPPAKKSAVASKPGDKITPSEKAVVKGIATVNPYEGISDGKRLFKMICSACHSIGQGKMWGTDLRGVKCRQDKDWSHKWIHSSRALVNSGDAEAVRLFEEHDRVVMTDQKFLSVAQIDGILVFVNEETLRLTNMHKLAGINNPRLTTTPARKVSVYEKWAQYFWYVGFAFIILSLFIVVSIMNKLAR